MKTKSKVSRVDDDGRTHVLYIEWKKIRAYSLVEELDDDEEVELRPAKEEVTVLTCSCGKLDRTLEAGTDVVAPFEHHVSLATMKL